MLKLLSAVYTNLANHPTYITSPTQCSCCVRDSLLSCALLLLSSLCINCWSVLFSLAAVMLNRIQDRAPLRKWSSSRVTLVGGKVKLLITLLCAWLHACNTVHRLLWSYTVLAMHTVVATDCNSTYWRLSIMHACYFHIQWCTRHVYL
jgi:hypothetical protein